MPSTVRYPAPRARPSWPARAMPEGFITHETTRGYVTVTDAETDVIRFSGIVSRVDLRAETFGVVVRLTDRDGREADTITLRADEARTMDIPCSVVRASNAVAASVGVLQVVGYFQSSGQAGIEPAHAPVDAAPAPGA